MTQAMYAVDFFVVFRVGEIVCRPTQLRGNVFILNQTVFMKNTEDTVSAIKVSLRNYKHCDPGDPVDLFVNRQKLVCPISTVLAYLGLRGTSPGLAFFFLLIIRHYRMNFVIAT